MINFLYNKILDLAIILILFLFLYGKIKKDYILKVRIIFYITLWIIAYSCKLIFLNQLLLGCAPVYFIILFFLHYRSVALASSSLSFITFEKEICPMEAWISDILKAQLYAHYSGKTLYVYFMLDQEGYLIFNHPLVVHVPPSYLFLQMIVDAHKESCSLLIDRTGHVRSINPVIFDTFIQAASVVKIFFDNQTKSYTMVHDTHVISHISLSHLCSLLIKLFDTYTSSLKNEIVYG